MMRQVFAISALALAACSGVAGGGGGASFGAADPSLTAPNPGGGQLNPFLANGDAVVRALDAIAQKSGTPMRVTSMNADTINGLMVDVQEPKNHINVDQYTVAPDGTISGPTPVRLMSMGGGPITAQSVDAQAFDPKAVAFPKLADTIRAAIAKSNFSDARVANWEIDGLAPDDRRYIYLEAARARPVAAIKPDMTIERVSF